MLRTLKRLSDWMVSRGSARLIKRDGKPYLLRHYLIRTKYFNILLHRFYQPDDGGPRGNQTHDHPWANLSVVLTGGYRELFHDGSLFIRNPGYIGARPARLLHRIHSLLGEPGDTFTLFLTLQRTRTWGFFQGNFDEVTSRTMDENIKGWFLPKGSKMEEWEENDLLEEWDDAEV